MAFLDSTVVNVALPVMQRDLDIELAQAQWVVEAYALLLASFVLVGGAVGDRLGRRRMFVVGVVLFALASILCGAAPSAGALILARAAQGGGAALLVPGSLSLISAAYADRHARGAAIGTWSAFSAITSAVGPVAGGWVVGHASWRWIFFLNIPIAAVVIVLSATRVDETRDETAAGSMDWLGASLATLGLALVVYGLLDAEATRSGGTARLVALVGAGGAALVAFLVVEAHGAAPMVPLSLFRSRTFSGTNALTLLLYAGLGGGLFFVPFDLIQVQGYPPSRAGAALLPFVLIIALMSRWTGAIAERIGARWPLVVGPFVAAIGFALLALPGVDGTYWTTFFPGIVVLGVGMGITVAPLTAAVMGSVEARHAGVASGINNAVSRAAGLLAVAALGVTLLVRFNHVLDERLTPMRLAPDVFAVVDAQRTKLGAADFSTISDGALRAELRRAVDDAFVAGFRTLMMACASLAALGALVALWLVEPLPGPSRHR